MKLEFTGDYHLMYQALVEKHPQVQRLIVERVKWFRQNHKDSRLDNHALHKSMKGKWAFSVTDDIRIVYRWTGKTTVRFLAIGPHETVYKKSS